MRGVSRTSLAEVEERFNSAAGSADFGTLADDLFAIADLLDREHGLRRAVADPPRPAEQKAQIMRVLLEGKVCAAALETAVAAAEAKWARPRDLADVLERFGVVATVAEAEGQGRLDDLDDELFRFGRIVQGHARLEWTLSDPSIPAERKRALLEDLLRNRVTPSGLRLITQVVVHPRGRSLEAGLEEFGRLVAEQRQRLVAVVRSAVPLSDAQRGRLAAWLSATYGRDIRLNCEVDPKVIGGFSVRIGDEVIDTTILGRIEEVRRRLAG